MKMYSLLEQHTDGWWWYHPGKTFNTPEEAEKSFSDSFGWDLSRPHKIFEHNKPLFQEWSTCTKNFRTFQFGGIVKWREDRGVVELDELLSWNGDDVDEFMLEM